MTLSSSSRADKVPKLAFLTAPAGNIGRHTGARLVAAGAPISLLALEADVPLLSDAVRAAADVHVGSLADEDIVVAASRGADSMLLVMPPVLDVDDVAEAGEAFAANALAAIAANGIERVVFISSQGAGASDAVLIEQCYDLEGRLREAAPDVRALRPGPLMENFLNEVDPIAAGVLPLVARRDTPLTLIAAADVGEFAAELLLDRSWSGFEAVPLRGPDVLLAGEIADRLSTLLGRKVAYAQISASELVGEMVKHGIARGAAEAIAEVMDRAANLTEPEEPDAEVTPTPFDAFVREKLAPALAGGL